MGWKTDNQWPEHLDQCVMIAAPHTSNWDALYARLALKALGVNVRLTIKDSYMKLPFGPFVRAMGGIGINRRPKNEGEARPSMVELMTDLFKTHPKLVMLVTPEGGQLHQPARCRRSGRTGPGLWRAGRRRTGLPRHLGIRPGSRDDPRDGDSLCRGGLHPVVCRRECPASRTSTPCCAAAPTRLASTPARSAVRRRSTRSRDVSATRCSSCRSTRVVRMGSNAHAELHQTGLQRLSAKR